MCGSAAVWPRHCGSVVAVAAREAAARQKHEHGRGRGHPQRKVLAPFRARPLVFDAREAARLRAAPHRTS